MDYRSLGRTGVKVSELCLGTMQFGWTADEQTSYQVMSAAFEAGVNFLDSADIYSNWAPGNPGGVAETYIGNWITGRGIPRDQLILATKVRGRMGNGPNDEGLSRRHIMQAAEASLRRLQTDYIDLYQTHWPDEDTPIEETLSALSDLVQQGKVRYIGCSNYPAWRLVQSLWAADRGGLARFECVQPHYSMVHRKEYEGELAEVCRTYGLAVIPYSPLGGGFLSGKYRPGQPPPSGSRGETSQRIKGYATEQNWRLLERMDALASEHGKPLSAVALAWLLADPLLTSPIIGPRTTEQLAENLQAVGYHLSPAERANLMA